MDLIGYVVLAVVVTLTIRWCMNTDFTPTGKDDDEDDYHINW